MHVHLQDIVTILHTAILICSSAPSSNSMPSSRCLPCSSDSCRLRTEVRLLFSSTLTACTNDSLLLQVQRFRKALKDNNYNYNYDSCSGDCSNAANLQVGDKLTLIQEDFENMVWWVDHIGNMTVVQNNEDLLGNATTLKRDFRMRLPLLRTEVERLINHTPACKDKLDPWNCLMCTRYQDRTRLPTDEDLLGMLEYFETQLGKLDVDYVRSSTTTTTTTTIIDY